MGSLQHVETEWKFIQWSKKKKKKIAEKNTSNLINIFLFFSSGDMLHQRNDKCDT